MKITIEKDLELRQLEQSDSLDIFKIIDSQREYLGEFLPFVEKTKQIEDTERFVNAIVNAPDDRFEYVFTIRKQKEFVGVIGFKRTDRINKRTEIGYWLSENHQKQGIITKSVKKLCNFAFIEQEINRIEIKCAVGNKASINIPKKLSFKYEGRERDGELLAGNIFTDIDVYSKLRKD